MLLWTEIQIRQMVMRLVLDAMIGLGHAMV
jgi:hypothetical protein